MATALSPALIAALLDVQRRAAESGHGGKEAIYAAACEHLGSIRTARPDPFQDKKGGV